MAVVADTWAGLPVRDGAVDRVLVVFAPRNGAETARVLAPGGRLVVVTPAADHLAELVGPLGLLSVDPAKAERLAGSLGRTWSPPRRAPTGSSCCSTGARCGCSWGWARTPGTCPVTTWTRGWRRCPTRCRHRRGRRDQPPAGLSADADGGPACGTGPPSEVLRSAACRARRQRRTLLRPETAT